MPNSVLLITITVLLTINFHLHAAETDQFSKTDLYIEDSTEILNDRANYYIEKSITALNKEPHQCREEDLYKELRKYFNNHLKGILMKEILRDARYDKRPISLEESIYNGWSIWDGLGMGLPILKSGNLVLTGVMRIDDETIGTDKLEHFWGQGFYYFSTNYLKNQGTIKALKIGITKEKTILGGNKIGNGVFSYGDLGANFNGMRFWNHILQKRVDVLGSEQNIGPYIVCENNKWKQVKDIDFRDYIDDSMDESINCSKFPSQSTVKKVLKALKKRNLSCPTDREKLDLMIEKYGELAHWMINEEGIGKLRYTREFKTEKPKN